MIEVKMKSEAEHYFRN